MTKQEKIQEAWKEFPNVKYDIDNGFAISYCINGVTDILDDPYEKIEWKHLESDLIEWRPKSLKGIENNNGWIKIKSEEDLPKDEDSVYWVTKDNEIVCIELKKPITFKKLWSDFKKDNITHYQPIQKPKPPIY